MPVKTLPRSALRPAEVGSVAQSLYPVLAKAPQQDALLHTINGEMKRSVDALEERSGQKLVNLAVQPVVEADATRDQIYQQMLSYLRGLRFSPDPEQAAGAEKLFALLVQHNIKLIRAPYAVESHHLRALFIDLAKEEYAGAVKSARPEQMIADLQKAQTPFENLYQDKVSTEATLFLPQLSQFVTPIRERLFEVLTVLGTLERLNPEAYKTVVDEANVIISEYAAKVRARRTRKQNSAEAAQEVESVGQSLE